MRSAHGEAAPRSMKLGPPALLALFMTQAALGADFVQSINQLRQQGCGGKAGAPTALRANNALDAVAKEWSRGGRLRDALARADYRIINSASMHVEGASNDRTLMAVLADNYCEVVIDRSFSEIGVYRRDRNVWIVVADPFRAPADTDAAAVSREILQLVNAARAQPRKCGGKAFRAAPPLKLSPLLERAAHAHAKDMATHDFFEHRGSDSTEPAHRVTRAGYRWRAVGENIAAGAADAKSVVQGWIDSPGHCANIMGPQFAEMGVAFVVNPKSRNGVYWAQVFATQR